MTSSFFLCKNRHMPAKKKKSAKKVTVKKSAPKKNTAKRTASTGRENHRNLDEKNQLIIIGAVVAIILFILGSVIVDQSRNGFHPAAHYVPINTPAASSSGQ